MTATAPHPDLVRAVQMLAGVCDGALKLDGVGFNGTDTKFGHRMAEAAPADWTAEATFAARQVVVKYRVQLDRMGVDVDAIPSVPNPSTSQDSREVVRIGRRHAYFIARGQKPGSDDPTAADASKGVDVLDGRVVVTFPFNRQLVDECRNLPGRRWEAASKRNTFPLDSAAAVVAWAQTRGFTISDAATKAANGTSSPAEATLAVQSATTGTVVLEGQTLIMRAPYNAARVRDVRQIPGRRWTGEHDTFPLTSIDAVLRIAGQYGITVDASVSERLASLSVEAAEAQRVAVERVEASRATDAEVEVEGLGGTLRPFQRAGVAYAAEVRRTFIADEMGLGKTVQALAAAQHLDAFPLVVVCPATLKLNWKRETERWLPGRTVDVVSGRKCRPQLVRADVTIVNYDILPYWVECLEGLNGLVLDESHYVKNAGTAKSPVVRTKAAKELARMVPESGLVLLLSGTPLTNRPNELVSQLQILDQLAAFGGATAFRKRFCPWDGYGYNGSRNETELHDKLRQTCYVRRTKAQVLPELPAKQRSTFELEGSAAGMAEYNEAEEELLDFLAAEAARIAEELGEDPHAAAVLKRMKAAAAEHLVRIATLKRLAAFAKLDEAVAWVNDFLASGEKLVVFAHHRGVVKALADRFDGLRIDGEVTGEARQNAVDRFQNDPNVKVLVCSIKAAGLGITLTAASNVLFLEQDWTPAAHDQAEDRCHRIGQNADSVNAWYAIIPDTIDDEIAARIAEKRRIVDAVTDGVDTAADLGASVAGEVLAAYTRRALDPARQRGA